MAFWHPQWRYTRYHRRRGLRRLCDLTIILCRDSVRNGRTVRRFFHLHFYAVAGFYCDGPYSSFLDDRLPVSCNIGKIFQVPNICRVARNVRRIGGDVVGITLHLSIKGQKVITRRACRLDIGPIR